MKTSLFLLLSLLVTTTYGQDAKKIENLNIQTSSVCEMCKETIEGELIYEKGVKKVVLDLATNVVHIEYDASKNTPEKLRGALIKLGYSADDVPGDPAAFAKLPACCQKEGCGQPVKKQ